MSRFIEGGRGQCQEPDDIRVLRARYRREPHDSHQKPGLPVPGTIRHPDDSPKRFPQWLITYPVLAVTLLTLIGMAQTDTVHANSPSPVEIPGFESLAGHSPAIWATDVIQATLKTTTPFPHEPMVATGQKSQPARAEAAAFKSSNSPLGSSIAFAAEERGRESQQTVGKATEGEKGGVASAQNGATEYKGQWRREVDKLFADLEENFLPKKSLDRGKLSATAWLENPLAAKLEKMTGAETDGYIMASQANYAIKLAEALRTVAKQTDVVHRPKGDAASHDSVSIGGVSFNLENYAELNVARTILELRSLNYQDGSQSGKKLRNLAIGDLLWLSQSGFLSHITHEEGAMTFLQPYQLIKLARGLRIMGMNNPAKAPSIVFVKADITGEFSPGKIKIGRQSHGKIPIHELAHELCYNGFCKGAPSGGGVLFNEHEQLPGEKEATMVTFYIENGSAFRDLAREDPVAAIWYNWLKGKFKGKEFTENGVEVGF